MFEEIMAKNFPNLFFKTLNHIPSSMNSKYNKYKPHLDIS